MLFTYSNPVFPDYFADPFVLRYQEGYLAFGTAPREDPQARAIPVLYSPDLSTWTRLGGALELLPECDEVPLYQRRHYWAPEVVYRDGVWYMFYSCSDGKCLGDDGYIASQRLHVATATRPEGPYKDVGTLFARDEFCIDPHPFCDPRDGEWYLFFASNLTTGERPGTALFVTRLGKDMMPEGEVTVVLQATADWQVYHRNTPSFGQMYDAWHTLEGPHIITHGDRYYCLYSGGAWTGEGYGVGYGVASHPLGPWRDEWAHQGASFLHGSSDIVGPGHNSIVVGPDGETPFVVYHAWDKALTARRMCIDPLIWTPDGRPSCDGPTIGERHLYLGTPSSTQEEWNIAA